MIRVLAALVFLLNMNVHGAQEVRDHLGRQVALAKPAQRIVALAPHIVENLFAAGLGDRIVGAVEYCDYPEAAKLIPRVGAISAFSVEAIVDLKPDLVVVWHSGRGGKVMDRLLAIGLKVYASDPRSLEDVAKSIRDYGVLGDNVKAANRASAQFAARLDSLRQNYSELATVPTFYQVWNDPIQTLNGEHIISDVIELCGGKNVFAKSPSLAPKVSVESLIEQNPDVIIASGMGEARPEWLDDWRKWRSIRAVQKDNLYFVPPDLIQRHTQRILDGAAMLCEHLESARAKKTRFDE